MQQMHVISVFGDGVGFTFDADIGRGGMGLDERWTICCFLGVSVCDYIRSWGSS